MPLCVLVFSSLLFWGCLTLLTQLTPSNATGKRGDSSKVSLAPGLGCASGNIVEWVCKFSLTLLHNGGRHIYSQEQMERMEQIHLWCVTSIITLSKHLSQVG